MPTAQVLLIEDDPQMVQGVSEQLEALGLSYFHCNNGKDGLEAALAQDYELVILDLGLPQLGGAEVCRRLRDQKPRQPIIVFTGQRDEMHAVLLLELGADDYIRKPLSGMEFKARVRSLLRRVENLNESPSHTPQTFSYGELFIDYLSRTVHVRGKEVSLAPIEFDLLRLFCAHPNRAFHREEIVKQVWGFGTSTYDQNVRAHISRLRTKLTEGGATRDYIVTQRGHGYRLAPLGE